jgi:hypothetical protein
MTCNMTCYAAVRQTSAATEQLTARAVRRSPTRSDYLVRITFWVRSDGSRALRASRTSFSSRLLGLLQIINNALYVTF